MFFRLKKEVQDFGPAIKASEVIANALQYWGKHGERWVRGQFVNGDKVCFYGGLSVGRYGITNGRFNRSPYYPKFEREIDPYKRAVKYIYDELESQGYYRDIIGFNDNDASFKDVHKIACGALKRALADEEKETSNESK